MSVLVAAYNCAPYLSQTLKSALDQTYSDFEVIVVDDGSTDDTKSVLARYEGHPKLRILFQDNAGPSAAFNRARRVATGEYLAVLDGDDVCWPTRLARQVAYLDDVAAVAVLGVRARLVTEKGRAFGVLNYPSDASAVGAKMWPAGSGPEPAFCGPSVMMRAKLVEQVGGWNEAYRASQDFDIILKVSEHGAVANLPDILYDYRIHGAQISQTSAEAKAPTRYAVRMAARFRHRGDPVPNWCLEPPGRDALERMGEPVVEVDRIAFENLVYTAKIWAMRCGWTRASSAAAAAMQLAEKRNLGPVCRQRALGLIAMTRMFEGGGREVLKLLGQERELALGAIREQVRTELMLRLHQLKHTNVLLSSSD